MAIAEAFVAELRQEAATTRRVLERVPEDLMSWKPHEKSPSLGQLAWHIARIPRAIADLATKTDNDVPVVPRTQATSVAELLHDLDANVDYGAARLIELGDETLQQPWRMKKDGKTLMEMPRLALVRAIMLNHWYHHRGQLTVYLRMLDVPLPSVYGPTADEGTFGG